jgi:parallel beta-helix repeat protein
MSRLPPFVACALLALASPASADTLKVPAQFATITDAVAAAQDGDTISVAKGTYRELVSVAVPNVKLVGKNAVIDAEFQGIALQLLADGVSASGFTVVNGTDGIFASGIDISITKCKVRTCSGDGIDAEGAPTTVSGNTVEDCGADGIRYLHSLLGDGLIEKNACLRNLGSGIIVIGDATTISKNRCEQNQLVGMSVVVEGLTEGPAPVPQPVLISKNTCRSNGTDGLVVLNGSTALVTVDKNDFSANGDEGVFVNALNMIFTKNSCDDNVGHGFELALSGGTVEKNTASGNQDDGIRITAALDVGDGGAFGFGSNNTVTGNTCKGNRGDGIGISFGLGNTLDSNKCTGNGDDGIDVNNDDLTDTSLLDNTCSDNGHEGIDNSGQGTVITANVCKNNGHGIGPDIAGLGDLGLGTVSSFEDNKFGTGGESEPSRLDNYATTGP